MKHPHWLTVPLLSLICSAAFVDHPTKLPEPPGGYEWELIPGMSDEFDGNQIDKTKWDNPVATWRGRPPAGTVERTGDNEVVAEPFNLPMSLRMVTETYAWQPKLISKGSEPYPAAEELDDPDINTVYYDYVRSYRLVPKK